MENDLFLNDESLKLIANCNNSINISWMIHEKWFSTAENTNISLLKKFQQNGEIWH